MPSKILFVWECGGGYGHLNRYKVIIQQLIKEGHQVTFVVRNLRSATKIYGEMPVSLSKAPLIPKNRESRLKNVRPRSYLDVLYNQCCDSVQGLSERISLWHEIFHDESPDLIILDHSPTAVISLKARPEWPYVLSGTGFSLPPDNEIYPFFGTSKEENRRIVRQHRKLLDEYINPSLKVHGIKALRNCMELYDHKPKWLFGYPELDHFPQVDRRHEFLGFQESSSKTLIDWPSTSGPRVFIYSERHPVLAKVINILIRLGWPTLIVLKQNARQLVDRFQTPNIRFSESLVDINQIAKTCNFAITNASPNTSYEILREGKPLFMLPAHIEQQLAMLSVLRAGCGIGLRVDAKPPLIAQSLRRLADKNSVIHVKAKQMADDLKEHKKIDVNEFMLKQIRELLHSAGS